MIYLTLTLWLLMILLTGLGVYRLWANMLKPSVVAWVLIPGTLVCEMTYILGCLITGGEVRRARIIPSGDGANQADPSTEDTPRIKVLGPIVASLLSLVAGIAGILLIRWLLGSPVLEEFMLAGGLWNMPAVPRELPGSWEGFWQLIASQVDLLRHTTEFWGELEWTEWRVPLFVYLSICLTVRLAPAGRDLRWTLLSAAVLAVLVAVAGLISSEFDNLVHDVWPLVTYLWGTLLFLLTLTAVIRGFIALGRVLAGKR